MWFASGSIVKKRPWSRYFPVNFPRLFKTSFQQNTSGWMLLNLFIGNRHAKKENLRNICVYIDENLSWKHHCDIVSSKISNSIDILYISKDLLSKQYLKQLYFSFIQSYVNYAIRLSPRLYCATLSSRNGRKMETVSR